MPPIDPCGCFVDRVRSCYQTLMRFTNDPAEVPVPIRWFFVPEGTPQLPWSTVFGSGNWAYIKETPSWDGPGEVYPDYPRRPWKNGQPPHPIGNSRYPCGTEAQWAGNNPWPYVREAVNAAGVPICCFATLTGKLRGVARLSALVSHFFNAEGTVRKSLGLASTSFLNPPCWPCPHPKPALLAVTPSGWNPAWTTPALNLNQTFVIPNVPTTTPCFWAKQFPASVTENLTGAFYNCSYAIAMFTQLFAGHYIWGWTVQLIDNVSHVLKVEWGGFGSMSADCCDLQSVAFAGTIPGGIPPMGPIGVRCSPDPVTGKVSKQIFMEGVFFHVPSYNALGTLSKTATLSALVGQPHTYNVVGELDKSASMDSTITYFP